RSVPSTAPASLTLAPSTAANVSSYPDPPPPPPLSSFFFPPPSGQHCAIMDRAADVFLFVGVFGDSLNEGSVPAPEEECAMVCAGDPLEFCGAANRLELYRLSTVSSTATPSSTSGTA